MDPKSIAAELVKRGKALLDEPIKPQSDPFMDLNERPHAFVLACLMDRQMDWERAWAIPKQISQMLDGFSMKILLQQSADDMKRMFSEPKKLHRFPDIMSNCWHLAVKRIHEHYNDDASLIWKGKPSSAEVVYRFLEFKGIGPKIASMAANILARDYKIKFADYYSIDISVDRHVMRVFTRLGLCPPNAKKEQIQYKARALHPEFPGIMDLACFEIGDTWCKKTKPQCGKCYMGELCPTPKHFEDLDKPMRDSSA